MHWVTSFETFKSEQKLHCASQFQWYEIKKIYQTNLRHINKEEASIKFEGWAAAYFADIELARPCRLQSFSCYM